jgi:hypothetical protein
MLDGRKQFLTEFNLSGTVPISQETFIGKKPSIDFGFFMNYILIWSDFVSVKTDKLVLFGWIELKF